MPGPPGGRSGEDEGASPAGRSGGEGKPGAHTGPDPEELPSLEGHADAKAWLEAIGRAVATGRLEERPAQAAIRAVSEWVKAHEGELTALVVEDLQEEVERLQRELETRTEVRAVR